jgi:hypothetical protein
MLLVLKLNCKTKNLKKVYKYFTNILTTVNNNSININGGEKLLMGAILILVLTNFSTLS